MAKLDITTLMEATNVSDAILLERLGTGDQQAFQEIYQRYWFKLYEVARRKVLTEEDAEEIVQDIFVDLWERRELLLIQDISKFLYKAVKYQLLDYLKAKFVRQAYQDSKQRFNLDTDTHTEEQLALKDLSEAILTGIDQLPAKTQEIFRLNRLEGRSAKEIADLLQIPERTIEYHITQALRTMRSYLKDFIVYTLSILLSNL
ncbi:RNA polymerase sigma-70 factor [Spirosoma daeguense]